jgi:hypothetical protein
MAIFKKAAAPFRVPSLTEVSTDYAALISRKNDLDARRAAAERELHDLAKGKIPAALVEETTAARRARAAELLGDLADAGSINIRPSHADVVARSEALRAEIGAIDAALAVIAAKLSSAKSVAERAVCDATRDAYRGAYGELAKALAAAQRAHREAIRLRDDMDVEGIHHAAYLPVPNAVGLLGSPFERNVKLDYWLREAVGAGLLDASEVN